MSPADPDMNQGAGPELDTLNIVHLTQNIKQSSVPFSKMTREESLALYAEIRGRLAGTRFRYDYREFRGRHYWERGLLSCVIAGAKIPPQIAPDLFKVPRNKIIFHALRELERSAMAGIGTLITFLRETGTMEKAGGESYARDIESMVGIPSAIQIFALGLIRINLGARI
jgi:hypothetical protein